MVMTMVIMTTMAMSMMIRNFINRSDGDGGQWYYNC